jgi:hypothetical protein
MNYLKAPDLYNDFIGWEQGILENFLTQRGAISEFGISFLELMSCSTFSCAILCAGVRNIASSGENRVERSR